MNSLERITFLLGSGISIPADIPSTGEITETVLFSKDIVHHTDGNYYVWPDKDMGKGYVERIQKALCKLKSEIECYCQRFRRDVNYEDLYYVAAQINDSETGEYPNPVVQPFVDRILPDIQPLLAGKEGESRDRWQLRELAYETTAFIHDVVWGLLSKEPSRLNHLNAFREACLDNELSRINIFTINHDTVLERCFLQNHIAFTDGFGESENQVRYWKPDLFEKKPHKVRIFKLHGSVDWFRLRPHGGDWRDELIGIPPKGDPEDTRNPQGKKQFAPDGRPMMLIGTTNKILQYVKPIYLNLLSSFYSALKDSDNLVICGYGFGDREINTQISHWVFSSRNFRITIVDTEPEKLKARATAAMRSEWDEWTRKHKLAIIKEGIQNTSWPNIKRRTFDSRR